jgi:N-acetylmuramic acid 6-phosphate etherase
MFERLLTEQPNQSSLGIEALPIEEMLQVINAADRQVASAVSMEIPRIARVVEAVCDALSKGGRLFYIGAGTSGRLGVLDAAECPPTFNVSIELIQGILAGGPAAISRAAESVEDDPQAGARDLDAASIRPGDILIGISASGRTPYVLGAIARARQIGAITAGISCSPDSELTRAVDYPVHPITGPEVIAGSTRMRAGTATKMVLNMISTATMIRLGYVYGNLMVNVQPTNQKLEDRARRIIQQITQVSYSRACELLDLAGRSVPTAIVMEMKRVDRAEAQRLLAAAGGRIAEVLK